MIEFADIVLYFWAVHICYTCMNKILLTIGSRSGRYLHHVKNGQFITFIAKISIMAYGIRSSWNDYQRAMREDSNLDVEEMEAARSIKPAIDALIWLVGLLELTLIGCVCLCLCACMATQGRERLMQNEHF